MYVAMAVLFGLMTPMAGNLPAAAALPAPPEAELLINGSFETGDFTGWSTDDMASPFFSLGVYDDFEFLPLFDIDPTDGIFAVGHGFDGIGPDTIEFWQEVAIPPTVDAELSFDWRAAWDFGEVGGEGRIEAPADGPTADGPEGPIEDRIFDVVIEPAGGGAPLASTNILTTDSTRRSPYSTLVR